MDRIFTKKPATNTRKIVQNLTRWCVIPVPETIGKYRQTNAKCQAESSNFDGFEIKVPGTGNQFNKIFEQENRSCNLV